MAQYTITGTTATTYHIISSGQTGATYAKVLSSGDTLLKAISPHPEITVSIENGQDGHRFSFTDGDLFKEFILKEFNLNFQSKEIDIKYLEKIIGNGLVVKVSKNSYKILPDEFDFYYDFSNPETLGLAIAKNMVNGVLFEIFNMRCFEINTGDFKQESLI